MISIQDESPIDQPPGAPQINSIGVCAPLEWLRQGWTDFRSTRFLGAFYGVVFTAMGHFILLMYATKWQLTMGLISGFFLLGPFVCTGLYELSRQRDAGNDSKLARSLVAWRKNTGSIAFFAVILTFAMIVWVRVSVIVFALTSKTDFPSVQGVVLAIFSAENAAFLLVWAAAGSVFASIVFAISVVSIPMLLDREADTMIAIFSSVRALLANPLPLFVWAALIVAIVGACFALQFWPLVVTAPILGHATWHAYKALVAPD